METKNAVIGLGIIILFILFAIWITGDRWSQAGWISPDGTPDSGSDCRITGQNGC